MTLYDVIERMLVPWTEQGVQPRHILVSREMYNALYKQALFAFGDYSGIRQLVIHTSVGQLEVKPIDNVPRDFVEIGDMDVWLTKALEKAIWGKDDKDSDNRRSASQDIEIGTSEAVPYVDFKCN